MGPSRGSKYDKMFQDMVEEYAMRSGIISRRYGAGRNASGEREDEGEGRIEIHTYDMLHYASMDSLRRLIGRVLGRDLPKAIENFLRQTLHTEKYWVASRGEEREEDMACTNFIDSTVIERCRVWLEEHECAEKLFSKIDIGGIDRCGGSRLVAKEDELESFKGEIESLVPFDCGWRVRDVDEIFKISREETAPQTSSLLGFDSSEGAVGGCSLAFRRRQRGKPAPVEGKETQERPFVCMECGCAFKRQEHRNRHEKMHTGERPFKCPFPGCPRAFSRSDNMNSHYKTHSVSDRKKFYRFEDMDVGRSEGIRRREELRRRKSVRKNMEGY